jgi:hypothetical protein
MPDLSKVDPNGGFLCFSTHWRPDPKVADPDRPGQKLAMASYIPARPNDNCLCGSDKTYSHCCQPKRYWHPVCPNPDMEGYSLLAPQAATFRHVNGTALRKQLMEDTRLCCVDESRKSSFWILWGDPAWEDQYGILCFGDLELKRNRTLLVTAMSDIRMQTLLNLLKELTGERLGVPEIAYDPVQVIDKRSRRLSLREIKPRKR